MTDIDKRYEEAARMVAVHPTPEGLAQARYRLKVIGFRALLEVEEAAWAAVEFAHNERDFAKNQLAEAQQENERLRVEQQMMRDANTELVRDNAGLRADLEAERNAGVINATNFHNRWGAALADLETAREKVADYESIFDIETASSVLTRLERTGV